MPPAGYQRVGANPTIHMQMRFLGSIDKKRPKSAHSIIRHPQLTVPFFQAIIRCLPVRTDSGDRNSLNPSIHGYFLSVFVIS